MTDIQKIQEMARTICVPAKVENAECESCKAKASGVCVMTEIATELYNAGYRKADEVRKETVKEILQIIEMRAKNICFDTNEEQFAVCHTVAEIKQAISDKYGVEVEE